MKSTCEYGVPENGKLIECGKKTVEVYKFEDGTELSLCEEHLNKVIADTSIQNMNDTYSVQ